MQSLPESVLEQIKKQICRPEGTVEMHYHSIDLFDKENAGGVIMQIPSGQHVFRLERDSDFNLLFYHSTPGTGTRVSSIDLNSLPPSPDVAIYFTWTPDSICLYLGSMIPEGKLVSASGVPSDKQFRVGTDGSVFQIGDTGVEIMGVRMYQDGNPIVQPTAVLAWEEILKAISILDTGKSSEGFIHEIVVTNLTIAILVTGFEAYAKRRFLEIEKEGIQPDVNRIVSRFYPQKERDAGIQDILVSEANEAGVSLVEHIVNRNAINFQNYKDCKRAFNKGYGIKFGEIGIANSTLEKIQNYIGYRHRIIHISPLQGMLNPSEVPQEEPVFAKNEIAKDAIASFAEFIDGLHKATLTLR